MTHDNIIIHDNRLCVCDFLWFKNFSTIISNTVLVDITHINKSSLKSSIGFKSMKESWGKKHAGIGVLTEKLFKISVL